MEDCRLEAFQRYAINQDIRQQGIGRGLTHVMYVIFSSRTILCNDKNLLIVRTCLAINGRLAGLCNKMQLRQFGSHGQFQCIIIRILRKRYRHTFHRQTLQIGIRIGSAVKANGIYALCTRCRRHNDLCEVFFLLSEHDRLILIATLIGNRRFGLSGSQRNDVVVGLRIPVFNQLPIQINTFQCAILRNGFHKVQRIQCRQLAFGNAQHHLVTIHQLFHFYTIRLSVCNLRQCRCVC